MSKESDNYKISDSDYIISSIGNAYFSGLEFEELWNCVKISESREELDTAVSTSILLKELVIAHRNRNKT